MPFANHNGVRLYWEEQGSGTPLLLVMGHRLSSALWYPVIPALAAQHRVIWFDNRGTGKSDITQRVSMAELAGDALAVLDAAGVQAAHVFGVSLGGVITLELAMQQPQRVRSLILGCTGILSAEKPRMPASLRWLYYVPAPILRLLSNPRAYGSAAPPDAVARDMAMLAKEKPSPVGGLAQAMANVNYAARKENVAKLTMPALVLHGDEDRTVPIAYGRELAETLPNSRFVELKGAGHNFIVAANEASLAAILPFLREGDAA